MRADRLLSIMLLLQVHKRMTARDLAQRLEVSERTIHRDMEALSAAGVPVTAERGSGGGWALLDGFETKLTGLNQSEAQALFLAPSGRVLDDLGLGRASEAAFIRLMASLPAAVRRDAEFARERILVDGAPWHATGGGEDLSFLPVLQEAIWQERKLHLSYERGDGTPSERVVDPLGLVVKGRTWYFIAAAEGEPRSYRVSRVKGATVTAEPSVRPGDFDLAAFWAVSSSQFVTGLPRFVVSLRVTADLLRHLRHKLRYAHVEEAGAPDESGWAPVTVRFQTEAEACEQILGFGGQAVILEPASLAAKVVALAEEVVRRYAGVTT